MRQPSSQPAAGARWLAHPRLSVFLALVWLVVRESAAPADLVAATAIGLIVPRLIHGFLGPALRPRAPRAALRLSLLVLWDIVVSNVIVARIVLGLAPGPQPAWVRVSLSTRHPAAITLLASIITMTPGTVSCVVDDERFEILVHALDCADAAALAEQIKQRYERPLMEIFE